MLLFVGIFLFEQLSPTSNFGTKLVIILVHHRTVVQHLTNLNPINTGGGGRKGPGLQFGINHGHRGARREPKLFCKFIFCSW